jgi:hypothetical protein
MLQNEQSSIKYFLLTAGSNYYPESGTGDWIGFYATYEEALARVTPHSDSYCSCTIDNNYYDWFEIIDLSTWITNEQTT